MRILICHLSDIHFKPSNNPVMDKIEQIKSAIKSNLINVNTCFIIVSGDIANMGKQDEYLCALEFMDELEKLRKPTGPLDNLYFVLAPGNHDCNFEFRDGFVSKTTRDSIIESYISKNVIDNAGVNICTHVQANFESFRENLTSKCCSIGGNKLHRTETYVVDNKAILFQIFNTSWISKINEVPASLSFPLDFSVSVESANYYAVISIFHHPLHWLEPSNRYLFKKLLENSSDIIISGHEHTLEDYEVNKSETSNHYYAGGVLQDSEDPFNSSFNIIGLDFDKKLEMFEKYIFDKDDMIYKPTKPIQEWVEYKRNKYIRNKIFEFNKNFYEVLCDMDAKIEHPIIDPLNLKDIYVYPDLKVISMNKKYDTPNDHISGKNVTKYLLDKKKAIIIGESSIGKTAMAKTLCNDFATHGLIPIYVEGFEFRGIKTEDVMNVIHRKFVDQYSESLLESYKQIQITKRAILLDDIHLCNFNSEGKAKLMSTLMDLFDIIIIFADETFTIENLTSKSSSIAALDFTNCIITEFGHYLRRVLVKKWYSLGREYTVNCDELSVKCDEVCQMITELFGKNFLPSYPIYVLLVLHQLETSKNLNSDVSSYGHLYESLIKNCLIKISTKSSVVDINTTYLAGLAYYMYTHKRKTLSEDDIRVATDSYNNNYSQEVNYQKVIGELMRVKLLKGSIFECSFQYPYIYYYFVAKYLSDKIETDEIKTNIANMAQKLYNEDYGNIMIFLCHLSKSAFIINKLIENATSLYSNYEPCDFDHHGRFIKSMYDKIPKAKLLCGDPEKNKEKLLKYRDKFEANLATDESASISESDKESSDYCENIDDIMQLNKAFKTIQVLGQVIKNFPGSIDGDTKFFVAEECHLLGMRTLNAFLSLIDECSESLIENLLESYKSDNKNRHTIKYDVLEERARIYLFKMIELVSIGMLKKVADSIGSESLRGTYKLLMQHHSETSFLLTNLLIKLDCLHVLPVEEIIRLGESLETNKNLFSLHILKRLIVSYFYLNECDLAKKEKLCDKLKISKKDVKFIAAKGFFDRMK